MVTEGRGRVTRAGSSTLRRGYRAAGSFWRAEEEASLCDWGSSSGHAVARGSRTGWRTEPVPSRPFGCLGCHLQGLRAGQPAAMREPIKKAPAGSTTFDRDLTWSDTPSAQPSSGRPILLFATESRRLAKLLISLRVLRAHSPARNCRGDRKAGPYFPISMVIQYLLRLETHFNVRQ